MRTATGRRDTLRLTAARAGCRLVVAGVLFGSAAVGYAMVTGRTDQPAPAGVVCVTVVVAAVLWLLRDVIDRLAARAALGDRADAYVVIRELTEQLADTLPVDEVAPRVAEAASYTTGRPRAEVRLWLPDGRRWARSWPPAAAPIGAGTAVEVRRTGTALGEIVVAAEDPGEDSDSGLSSRDRRMLDTLARPAGAALSTVRLTVELQQRKTELEHLTAALRTSRERLLTARATEQQRMRAEVADRVGPHLAAALAAVDAGRATSARTASLATAAREAELALDELRTIARGIYPPTLTEVGLAASLESWLARAGVDATLEVVTGLGRPAAAGGIDIDPDIAACLYFCTVTSLGRLTRHRASAIRVGISDRSGPALSIAACVAASVAHATVDAVTDRIEAFGGSVHSTVTDHEFAVLATLPGWVGGGP